MKQRQQQLTVAVREVFRLFEQGKPRLSVEEAARGLAGGCASIGGARRRIKEAMGSVRHSTPVPEDHKRKAMTNRLLLFDLVTISRSVSVSRSGM